MAPRPAIQQSILLSKPHVPMTYATIILSHTNLIPSISPSLVPGAFEYYREGQSPEAILAGSVWDGVSSFFPPYPLQSKVTLARPEDDGQGSGFLTIVIC